MRYPTDEEAVARRLLQRARTVAVVGASPRTDRHSNTVCRYLHQAGFEVLPVRPDRADVAGLPSWARLADVPGRIDLVVLFRAPDAAAAHIAEAAEHGASAVWLQPGAVSPAAEAEAKQRGVLLVRDRCIEEVHRHARREMRSS